jgi:hypothetical protein
MTNSTFEEPKHPETGDPYFLSTRTIPPEERLILALDVSSVEAARALVERLDDAVQFYKVGLELLGTGSSSNGWSGAARRSSPTSSCSTSPRPCAPPCASSATGRSH